MPYIKTTCKAERQKSMNFIIHIDLTREGARKRKREQDSEAQETSQPEDGRENSPD